MLSHILRRNIAGNKFQLYNRRTIMKTAGILIIGDEILKGQTQDTNSHYLSRLLHSAGIAVKRIVVISDDIDEISTEVLAFSRCYDYVLTSGGIGPTHDDRTLEAVALAFHEKATPHPTLVKLCTEIFGNKPLDSPELKMAHIPQSAVLHFGFDAVTGQKFRFPLIAVKNVFLFPGIPSLLEKLADNLKNLFKGEDKFYTREILVDDFETTIAVQLNECQNRFSSAGVTVGSYPDWSNNYYKVKVIVESTSSNSTEAATKFLMEVLPLNVVVQGYVKDPISLRGEDVYSASYPSSSLKHKVAEALQTIEEAFTRYSYNEICIGFNGGKDCTALLHLVYAVICRKLPDDKQLITSLYVKDSNPFDEVDRFMTESCARYKLQMVTIEDKLKPALDKLKVQSPDIKAVLMGTRFTDPYSRNLAAFSPTDGDWPEFMRINPMLKWSYHDIWEFLRTLCLPYCVLYDRGYTSLGSKENTKRNEKLRYIDEHSNVRYKQAYRLQDEDFERNGRL